MAPSALSSYAVAQFVKFVRCFFPSVIWDTLHGFGCFCNDVMYCHIYLLMSDKRNSFPKVYRHKLRVLATPTARASNLC